jgi:hypothetical protein
MCEGFEGVDWPYDCEDRQAAKEVYWEYMEWISREEERLSRLGADLPDSQEQPAQAGALTQVGDPCLSADLHAGAIIIEKNGAGK